jgi:hypothetical protein
MEMNHSYFRVEPGFLVRVGILMKFNHFGKDFS